jgi:outer membrane biosynthesis protein TonB
LASENTLNEESDALTGLAYIGNLRNHKGAASEKRIPRPMGAQVSGDQTQDTEENGRPETHFVWYGLFVASLVGILALLFTWQNNPDPRPASQPTQQQRQPARMAEEIKPQETQQNQAPKAAQRPVSQNQDRSVPPTPEREPIDTFESQESNNTTSFRESRAFKQAEARSNQQEREMQEDPYQDDYYYDQGDRPPEQDPVRSQLSRETTDPRNSWADDLESINDNPEYYEPEYVEPGVYPEEELYEEY